MSDYRNQGGYGRDRFRDENERDDRFGRTDERTARRGGFNDEDRFRSESFSSGRESDWRYGGRDDERRDSGYGRGDYGYGRGESGYGRGSSGDYLSNAAHGYGRSSYGGVDFDRSERSSGFGNSRSDYGAGRDYGSDRDYGRNDYGRRDAASGYGADRYREAFGRGSDYRDRDGRGGYGSDANRPGERSFFERAGDEISSWFGDHDAERRREADRQYGGRGPKNYTRSDERIRDDINDRLTDDHYLDASDIDVTVKDREVTLTGHVSSRDQKRRAEDVAERVSGVTHVQNNLRVQSQSQSQGQWSSGGSTAGSTGFNTSTAGTTSSTGSYGGSTGGTSGSTLSGDTAGTSSTLSGRGSTTA